MKKTFITAAFAAAVFLLSVSFAYALGMTAGTVRILVDVGSSSNSSFGLVNSGNETITVTIRAEGDAAQFLEIPTKLELAPQKLTYVNIIATIPSTYDGSLGGNITGSVYAVQEGAPGQVQVNVQAQKAVQILIPKYGGHLPEAKTQTESSVEQWSILTGLTALPASNPILLISIAGGALALVVFVIFIRRFDISIKSKRR